MLREKLKLILALVIIKNKDQRQTFEEYLYLSNPCYPLDQKALLLKQLTKRYALELKSINKEAKNEPIEVEMMERNEEPIDKRKLKIFDYLVVGQQLKENQKLKLELEACLNQFSNEDIKQWPLDDLISILQQLLTMKRIDDQVQLLLQNNLETLLNKCLLFLTALYEVCQFDLLMLKMKWLELIELFSQLLSSTWDVAIMKFLLNHDQFEQIALQEIWFLLIGTINDKKSVDFYEFTEKWALELAPYPILLDALLTSDSISF